MRLVRRLAREGRPAAVRGVLRQSRVARALAGLAAATSLLASSAPALAAPPAPTPVEQELFDSWVGKYTDIGTKELWAQFGLAPAADKALSFAPSQAQFYDRVMRALKLPNAVRERFEKEGVVVVPQGPTYSMAAALYAIYTSDLPLLVTTDSVLDAMHRSFDSILADLEENVLSRALHDALGLAQRQLPELVKKDPVLTAAALDADVYLTVAMNLLETEPDHGWLLVTPRFADPKTIQALLAKVAGNRLENPGMNGLGTTIYGGERAVDWTQFTPRGHYARSEKLQRYFRAMMWLGRADTGFELDSERQLRAAAVLTRAMDESGAAAKTKILTDVVDLMVGRADNLTPTELAGIMRQEKLLAPGALASPKSVARLSEALAAAGLGAQRIRSQLVVSPPEDPKKHAPPGVFQLFGQRFILDSFVLSKVVYDDILYKGQKQERKMPTGLDVMASLGSNVAAGLLQGELDQWHYGANLAALRDVVGAYTPAHWGDSLYNRWLDALRALNTPPAGDKTAAVPEVMRRESWGRKMLQTQLASWAELRHDTILYAKPSYTASVGCVYPIGYVEPYVDFYAKLGTFASDAATRFDSLRKAETGEAVGRLQSYAEYFRNFATTMGTLGTLAAKELAGKPFDRSEEQFLKNTIERTDGPGGYMPTPEWNGWYIKLVYAPGGSDEVVLAKPTIADVHTDPDAERALEVGTGNVDFVVAAIDNRGDRAIYVGPSLSYYEFTQPASKRLTDEEWTTMVGDPKQVPARPSWMNGLLVK